MTRLKKGVQKSPKRTVKKWNCQQKENTRRRRRPETQAKCTTNKKYYQKRRIKHAPCQFRSLNGDFPLRASTWPLYVGKFFLAKNWTNQNTEQNKNSQNQSTVHYWVMLFFSRGGRPIIGSISQHGLHAAESAETNTDITILSAIIQQLHIKKNI